MSFMPHTDVDIDAMLDEIGLASVDDLFADIPAELRAAATLDLPDGVAELDVVREAEAAAARNVDATRELSFLGMGSYDHYVPAVVPTITGRSEFATAYTPYQPEISQGTLQAIFEFQTCISELTGLPIANASLYDGATAVAEAMYLSEQVVRRTGVVVLGSVSPRVRAVLDTYAHAYDMQLTTIDPGSGGTVAADVLAEHVGDDTACVIVQQPNVFGLFEDVPALCAVARDAGAVPVVSADPLSLGVLQAPGDAGAGIVVGEGQALGNAMSFGGPTFGFFAAEERFTRRMPGRIVGESRDARGSRAYVLTLQTREQHIRREKATSNICTNQALNALAGTIYMGWLGPQGIVELGDTLMQLRTYAREQLVAIDGVDEVFDGPGFKEVVVRVPGNANDVADACRSHGVNPGIALADWYPELGDGALLIAVTERHTASDIDSLATTIAGVIA